jgi:EAL domain-containing protein (putative c-di-GMP-specific phosphodiesterase class I)
MQANISARVALEAGLRKALANNEFVLHYQLQTTHTGEPIGAEALIRWKLHDDELMGPSNFIPLAEETGMIVPIGQWALETACAQLKEWEKHPQTSQMQLAVNVSARQFHQADFVEQVTGLINRSAIRPDRLKLELTESLVLDDIDDTIRKMNQLRKLGIHFSMDDFGTGHSSLSSLKKLPLDQLKIDQSFVRDITTDPEDAAIVETIIAMARHLQMEIIAEGVETEAQRAFLEKNGCAFCQGYLFGKPMSAADLSKAILGK